MNSEIYELDRFLTIIDIKIKNTKALTYMEFLTVIDNLLEDIEKLREEDPELTHVGFTYGGP